MEDQPGEGRHDAEAYNATKASKFRLKSDSKSKSSKRHHGDDEERSSKRYRPEGSRHSRRTRQDSERGHKRHRSSKTVHDYTRTFTRSGEYQDPDKRYRESLYDGLEDGDEQSVRAEANRTDPDGAFRESLFDALADDEGAAYWEGVYGQPIHIYSNTKSGPDGTLERMSDEEYAEYVRSKMWEKTHEHIIEEREARAKQRKQQNQQKHRLEEDAAKMEAEHEDLRRQMREALKRGEERKKAKELEASWLKYVKKWEDLKGYKELAQETVVQVQDIIPWPVASGKLASVSKDRIEHFFEHSSAWEDDAAALLKVERVRWHPDKMQQRFGHHIDPDTMKSVTAVFQVVDKLWNEHRK